MKHISINILGGSREFFHGDGLQLTSAHTDLRWITKYLTELGLSKQGDKTERSFSFFEMNEQKM